MAKRKKQTFKNRLMILMDGDKPYTWAKKVGIEKGLFQYYWQKGKVPTYVNLIKIQNHSGCSLDWLLTGKQVDPLKPILDGLTFIDGLDPRDVKAFKVIMKNARTMVNEKGSKLSELKALASVSEQLSK